MENKKEIAPGKVERDKSGKFKEGQPSANPFGRPRGSRNKNHESSLGDTLRGLSRLAKESLSATKNGKRVKIPKIEVAITQILNKAVQGDEKALKLLLPHLVSADVAKAKEATMSEFIDVGSPRFMQALIWIVDAFSAAVDDVFHIDYPTKNHLFLCLGKRLEEFEDKLKGLNDWEPGTEIANPFAEDFVQKMKEQMEQKAREAEQKKIDDERKRLEREQQLKGD